MTKFGSEKARSGRTTGVLARVSPDRASCLTGPRIVRTFDRINARERYCYRLSTHGLAPVELTNGDQI